MASGKKSSPSKKRSKKVMTIDDKLKILEILDDKMYTLLSTKVYITHIALRLRFCVYGGL